MKSAKEIWIKLIATGLGSGYAPIAPGTAGTLLAMIIFLFLPYSNSLYFIGLTALLYFVGVWVSSLAEIYFGHDGSQIVIDEVVGYMISVAFLPFGERSLWLWALIAFFLFRFFDIIKPQPADKSQELPKGWGIMTDDVVAGLYTNLALQIAMRFVF